MSNDSIQRAIVVLGVHRSGTSVLARGLQALGVSVGANLLDGNEWNPHGYFEHAGIVHLNDTLLGLAGKRWDSLALPPSEVMEPLFEPYKAEALALLERDFADATLCGIKDPRASRLLPFWQSVFARAGMDDCYVISLRNPISVARSLAARDGFAPEKSYLLWLFHLIAAIKDTEGKARIVVDYDTLIADPAAQLRRIAAALDLTVTDAIQQAIAEYADNFLSESLRHSVHDPVTVRDDPRIGELVGKAYDLLRQLAQDAVQTPHEVLAFEREWRALEQVLRDTAPIFAYLDACEDRIDALTPYSGAAESAPVELQPAAVQAHTSVPSVERVDVRAAASDFRVSVVIPLYNHEQYIEAAIKSVLAQTVPPVEIIVIDDGSTDGSLAKVSELRKEHPEIIFWSWPNQGAHHTLNAAIHRATGDFVAVLNSDDCYAPERLEACLAVMQTDPTVDVVATGVSFIDGNGQNTASAWYEEARVFYREEGDLSLGLIHANFLLTTSNLFIRRSVFELVGYFAPLRYTHDLEFFLRLILAKKQIHFLDRPLLAYRFHGDNTISENQARVDVELAAIFAYFLYRQGSADGGRGVWLAWLDRYVQILGQKKLLELVEYFLALLAGKPAQGILAGADSLATEFRALLSRLGADWNTQETGDSVLTQFVAARNEFLRRWENISVASKLKIALAKQELTIAELQQSFELQERNIEQLRTSIQPLQELVAEKVQGSQIQAAEIHRLNDVAEEKVRATQVQAVEIRRLNSASQVQASEIDRLHDIVGEQSHQIQRLTVSEGNLNDALVAKVRELTAVKQSNWHKLGEALRQRGPSLKKLVKVAYYFAACVTPQSWKPVLQPLIARLTRRYKQHTNPASGIAPQPVKQLSDQLPDRLRVLHVIANFMLGGSSRLVVDLIEGLGDTYQHKVVTSYLPVPPVYAGVDVVEFRSPQSPDDVLEFLREYDPDIVHVHYWGDCDWGWYDIFFRAVQTLGCSVIENINTPVQPYKADFVDRYVYVSSYVQQNFGDGSAHNLTIYPGSDFGLFARTENLPLPPDCIGMVYRLETDKLNLQSIDVFIKVVQKRPQTKAIIVGGGTYLEPYRQAVQAAGVMANFEFTGYVEYTSLPALYERMSIFVAPVWKESFGQVSPFAMSKGIPVVGYNVGGLAEIVDDTTLLAPSGDSDALADLVIQLLEDPMRCRQIGERNRGRAQAFFSVEAMTRAYRGLYGELMKAQKCG